MDIDFAFWLVLATAVTGAFSLVDFVFLRPGRMKAVEAYKKETGDAADPQVIKTLAAEPTFIEFPKSFFPVLLVVLIVRSFLVEPFKIPSGSMEPTLEAGDFILVNKYAYGLRLPVLGSKVWPLDDPKKADVMVFKYPEQPRINYIKRVIGEPGDKISYYNKELKINGEPVPHKVIAQIPPARPQYVVGEETLGDVTHRYKTYFGENRTYGEWTVPEGHYFVMGDNRDNSRDSRSWGYVPDSLIVGRAFAVWMHLPGWVPSFERNGLIK